MNRHIFDESRKIDSGKKFVLYSTIQILMSSSRPSIYLLLSCFFGIAFILFTFLVVKSLFLSTDQYINQLIPETVSGFVYTIARSLAFLYVPLTLIIISLFFRFAIRRQKNKAIITLADKEVFGLLHLLKSIGLVETCYPSGHVTAYVV